jgi:hypothetical protein
VDRVVESGEVPARLAEFGDAIRAVVILEDFIGTGTKAQTRLKELHSKWTESPDWREDVDIFFVAVCGFDRGVDKVQRVGQRLDWSFNMIVDNELGDTDRCFGEESEFFSSPENRERARDICFDKGQHLEPSNPLGYGDTEAAICFEYRCPNNSLPVLWASAPNWQPLFPRF